MTADPDRPTSHLTGAVAVSVALVVAALALLASTPGPAASQRTLRALPTALDPLDPAAPVLAVLGLAAWALTAYLALGVSLVLLGRLPGLTGRLAAAVALRTVPVAVRRTVETALGAGLVLTTLGAVPASAAVPHVTPATANTSTANTSTASTSTASLDWPDTSAAAPEGEPATPDAARPQATSGSTHVVRPGDTLWDLAAQALRTADGPEPSDVAVAAAWPSWWEANRDAIGDDPHLLHPGTSLVAPPPAP